METEKLPIEWHKFKDVHIAFRGSEILGMVRQADDFPCEAFQFDAVNTMYTTIEAAKAEAAKLIALHLEHSDKILSGTKPPTQQNLYLQILREVVKALESAEIEA